jgi:penicillin V acylase-like amidase (Ntn superfamily)
MAMVRTLSVSPCCPLAAGTTMAIGPLLEKTLFFGVLQRRIATMCTSCTLISKMKIRANHTLTERTMDFPFVVSRTSSEANPARKC